MKYMIMTTSLSQLINIYGADAKFMEPTMARTIISLFSVIFALMIGEATAQKIVPQNFEQVRFSYAPLVKRIAPAVVNVYAARQVRQRRSPFAGDPFFEQFFGGGLFGRQPKQRTSRSLGSGVIIGADGIVITNHHVIKGADKVKVALSDGREFSADIILVDKTSDLAVLKMEVGQLDQC